MRQLEKVSRFPYTVIDMVLYHGSNAIVEKSKPDMSRKNLDFGPGFYTTANKDQAVGFARKVAIRKESNMPVVSVYDFDLENAGIKLAMLTFTSPDRAWLDFVSQNRRSVYKGKFYDLVIGPVANDDVFATLIVFEQGILNVEQTLESLKIKKTGASFKTSVLKLLLTLWRKPIRSKSLYYKELRFSPKPVSEPNRGFETGSLYNQFVFKSEKALAFLQYENSFVPGASREP